MLSDYRLDKIKKMLIDFHNVSGQRMGIYDADFNALFEYPDHCAFCKMMRSTSEGERRCTESDIKGMCDSQEKGDMIIYRCHAGLIEVCAPIFDNNEILGYLLFGQLFYKDTFDEQCKNSEYLVSDIVDDKTQFINAVNSIRMIDREYLISTANIMSACIRYIIYEQLLKYEKSDIWHKIIDYINNNYNKKITLDKMAKSLSVSVPTLCKVSKENGGITIGNLINNKRIEVAKQQLVKGDMTIAEISYSIGFDDYSYFTRVFKKLTGVTPSAWRKSKII